MNLDLLTLSLAGAVVAATPVLLAASGALLAEKIGVFNIGIEGLMLVGAVGGFITAAATESAILGLLGAAAFGGVFILVFAIPTLVLNANQLVSGFALWLMGLGIATYIGEPHNGQRATATISRWQVPVLSDIPLLGRVMFDHLWLVYVALLLPFLIHYIFAYTRHGLHVRAIGEDPSSADAAGIPILRWRLLYTIFSGALAGIGGAFLALGSVRIWDISVTGGLGWIALGVVIFSGWRPIIVIVGACLFGLLRTLGFVAQSLGWQIPSQFVSMLPYVGIVLILIGRIAYERRRRRHHAAPTALGAPFVRGS